MKKEIGANGDGSNWDEEAPALDELLHVAAPLSLRKTAIRFTQRGQGESSSSTAGAAASTATESGNEDCDRDMHSKRAKVNSGSQ